MRYIFLLLFMGISFINAENVQDLEKLKVEKQALELKLEAYTLKKKIIELENFIEKDKIEKEERIEREKALKKLKSDLKRSHNRMRRPYAG